MFREQVIFQSYEVLEYDRKSRSDDPLLSVEEVLEKHGAILDEYARANLGGSIPESQKYKEVGSSETINGRPEMLRLLKAIESPLIKAILVVDVQRLSRGDLEEAGRLIKLLRYTNTWVLTPSRPYDLRDEYDRDAFERELKRGNEYLEYYKKIQARGKLASIKKGNYVGSVAPYGYDRTTIMEGKVACPTLKEKKEEADVVRMIFNWYCNENIGVTAICRRLEKMNIKTKTGRSHWKPSIIFSMLENVHYIGCVRWNWRKTHIVVEDSEIKKLRPKAKVNEYLIFEGKHEPIINKEIFERAKEIRGNRHRTKTDTSLKNPFSGIMYCKCGAKMGYNTYRKNGVEYAPPKLVCNNQVHCKSGSVEYRDVLDYVCKSLRDHIRDFEVRVENEEDDSVKLHKKLVANLEKKYKELEEKELAQWDAQYNPDLKMPQHIFKRLNEQVLKEKEEVKNALCEARESIPTPVDYREKIYKFTEVVENLEDDDVSPADKNEYLKSIIDRINYERPPIVRITKKNAKLYGESTERGMKYHMEPFTITIELKAP